MKASEMTIEDAIKHAEEVAQRKCDECGSQHRQLADWLKELVALRAKLKVAEDALEECLGFAERYEMDDDYMQSDICSDIRGTVRNALAAIRADGGTKK